MGLRTRIVAVLAMTATALAVTAVVAAAGEAEVVGTPAPIRPVPRAPVHPASTTYTLTANGVPVPISEYAQYDYAQFSMGAGTAHLVVSKLNNTNVGAAYVSPIKLGYVAVRSGNTASFTIRGPEYLIVKLDGRRPLVIAADPAETDTPANKGPDIFNVTESRFGADPTGSRISTAAVQAALDAASAYGSRPTYPRGIVYVPRGVYSVANLDVRSNTSLYFEPGAVLRAVAQKNLYTIDAHKDSQNRDLSWWIQTAFGATNIKIFGRGTLDGNGPAMLKAGLGLNVLAPIASSNVTVDGVTVREASSWSVIPVRSNNVRFTNLKLLNRFDMGENDGIDVVESQDVTVRRGIGIGLDDPYTTKSYPQMAGDIGRNWPGQPEKVRNVVFDRLISWTYCYGFKVGQGVYNDHENVTFSNGVVYDAAVGIGIHHKAYRGRHARSPSRTSTSRGSASATTATVRGWRS